MPHAAAHAARTLALLLVTSGAPLAGACGPEQPAAISRAEFVDAYMALVRARINAEGDSAAYAAARDRALERSGVSAADLRDFVAAGREDPDELRLAWQAIAARLDTLYGGVTSGPPPELGAGISKGAAEP